MSKVTRATFKSFLKKNDGKLLIKRTSNFDGMYDCVMQNTMPAENDGFVELRKTYVEGSQFDENNLGYCYIWLTRGSANYFTPYSDSSGRTGFTVDNCCGSFTVAVKS